MHTVSDKDVPKNRNIILIKVGILLHSEIVM